VKVKFYPSSVPEAEITASPVEFAGMATRLAELTDAGSGEVVFSTQGGDGLRALVVRIESGPAVVTVEDEILLVSGGPEAVQLFGHNLPSEVSLSPGYHVHFEHVGREWFVAAESIPLVIVVGNAEVAN
jgi:hypothetical protein